MFLHVAQTTYQYIIVDDRNLYSGCNPLTLSLPRVVSTMPTVHSSFCVDNRKHAAADVHTLLPSHQFLFTAVLPSFKPQTVTDHHNGMAKFFVYSTNFSL